MLRRQGSLVTMAIGSAVLLVGLTGCGNRLPHSDVVAAEQGPVSKLLIGVGSGGESSANGTTGASGNGALGGSSGTAAAGGLPGSGAGGSAGVGRGGGSTGSGASSAGATGGGSAGGTSAGGPSSGGGAGVPSGSTIVLGNVGTYSGVIGASTQSVQPMLQVWAKWINTHGGLSGHPVKVISADDGANPSTNLSLTEQMVQQDHVVAFLDDIEPLTATANLNYLRQQGIPEVGGDMVSTTWNQSPIMFPQGTAINDLAHNGVRAARLSGLTKFGLLYCVETPDCTNAYQQIGPGGGAQAAGLDLVYSAQISLAQPDFTEECQQAQAHGVQILALGADADSLERLANSCNGLGYHPQYFAFSLEVVDGLKSDRLLNGTIAPVEDFPWFQSNNASEAAYLQAVQTYDPALQTSAGTSQMWTAGALLGQAISNVGGLPLTSANLIKGLDAIKNNSLGGLAPPLTFAAGQPAPAAPCYFVVQIKNGAWTTPKGSAPVC